VAAILAGSWEPAVEDESPWMSGMNIAPDGTFLTKWNGNMHLVTDGRVLVVGEMNDTNGPTINLKRTCEGHIFA